MGGGKQGGGGGHHGLEKTLALVLGSIVAFSWGVAALQAAVAMVTPTVRNAVAWLEAHGVLIGAVTIVIVGGYVWLRLKLRPRGVRTPQRWPGEQPVVYQFDPRRDRPGLIGTLGRWLAFRSGGPLIIQGGAPLGSVPGDDLEDDDDQVADGDASPSDGEASEDGSVPGHLTDEAERRYTRAQARRIFSAAMRPRHR